MKLKSLKMKNGKVDRRSAIIGLVALLLVLLCGIWATTQLAGNNTFSGVFAAKGNYWKAKEAEQNKRANELDALRAKYREANQKERSAAEAQRAAKQAELEKARAKDKAYRTGQTTTQTTQAPKVCGGGLDCNVDGLSPTGSFSCTSPTSGTVFHCCPSGKTRHWDNQETHMPEPGSCF